MSHSVGHSVALNLRLSEELVALLDAEAARLAGERPGERVTRSDVLRALIVRGLSPTPARATRPPAR